MNPIRLMFVLTSPSRGGVEEVVLALLKRLPPAEFQLALAAPRALLDAFGRDLDGVPADIEAVAAESWRHRGDVGHLARFIRPVRARAWPRARVSPEGARSRLSHADRRRRRPSRGPEGPSLSPRRLAGRDARFPRRPPPRRRRRQPPRDARGSGGRARHRPVGDLHGVPRRRRPHARRHRRARAAIPLRRDAAHRHRGRRHGAARRGHGRRRHTRGRRARRHRVSRPARESAGARRCTRHAARRRRTRPPDGRCRPAADPRTVRSRTAGGGHSGRVQERDDEVMTVEIAFWIAALVVGYAYIGYPLVLALMARWGTPPRRALTPRPRLSVVVAAYNEAGVIEAKIRSALEQSYPADRLEVIVVSDGSSDGTDERVRGFADRRVRLVRQEPRAGKSLALNRGVSVATGDLLIFTDANALFGPDSLARLAAGFHDPRVGLVSGQGLYVAGDAEAPRAVGNGYVRYEAFIKTREGLLGFVAGADGAIYALRREIYRDLGPAEVNDLLHPIQASLEGYASRFDGHAFTMELPSPGSGSEFRRHVRIIAQGFTLLSRWMPRLIAEHRWRAVWMLVSHRLLRWMSAPCLALALVANAWLAVGEPFYRLTLAGQAGVYGLALLGLLAERAALPVGQLAVPYYFCVVSAAGIGGVAPLFPRGGGGPGGPPGPGTGE